jgi:2-amino-4-hydroxy-6-hydroxymethyldihydropteridine diphosphokinase
MIEKSSKVYLGLGSNLGDRAAYLLRAIIGLNNSGLRISGVSSIYETEPLENPDQPKFLNLVAACNWAGTDPFQALALCLQIEARLGRERTTLNGPRTIDIDLLLLDDQIIEGESNGVALTLPHPKLHLRKFVLAPFAELAPQVQHPVLGETIYRLRENVDDRSIVRLYRG